MMIKLMLCKLNLFLISQVEILFISTNICEMSPDQDKNSYDEEEDEDEDQDDLERSQDMDDDQEDDYGKEG